MGMDFITIAPEDGFPRIPGFLHGRLTGAIRFASDRCCLYFRKIPLPKGTYRNVVAKARALHNPCFAAVISSTGNPVSAKLKLSLPNRRVAFFVSFHSSLIPFFIPIPSPTGLLEQQTKANVLLQEQAGPASALLSGWLSGYAFL
jgi:hypothetical protein